MAWTELYRTHVDEVNDQIGVAKDRCPGKFWKSWRKLKSIKPIQGIIKNINRSTA